MTSLGLRSRHCLVEDIKCLENQLSSLQDRFDVIVHWIRSQYSELIGLPEYIVIAVRGASKEKDEFSKDTFSLENTAHVKVEEFSPYDNSDELSHHNANDEMETDIPSSNLVVKLDDEILKDIESGPVSRLRIQLQKRKLACREISHDENEHRNVSYCNIPATTVHGDAPSFPLLFEGEGQVKCETEYSTVNSDDCNKPEGNDDSAPYHTTYGDLNELNRNENDPLTSTQRVIRERQMEESSFGIKRRVRKTPKHLEVNRSKGLIIDALEYKRLTESLPTERLNCIVCNKGFSTATKLRRHEFEVHLTKEEQSKLRIRTRNVNVVEKPENAVPTMCDICNKTFKNIESHRLNHLPQEVMATVEGSWRPHYRCVKCKTLFTNKKEYLNHVTRDCKVEESLENSNYVQNTLKLRTEKNFLCNECGQNFNRKHTLKIHELAVHAKKRDFKCQYCERTFVQHYTKVCHEKKHLGMSNVTCDLCGFSFTCKKSLIKHITGVHENRRPFKCQLCDKSFKTTSARNYHVNTHGNPNGRKRGLNRDVDPLKAAAKRRHCITWKKNRLAKLIDGETTADNENVSTEEVDQSQRV